MVERHGDKVWGFKCLELLPVASSEVERAEVVDISLGGTVVEETEMLDHIFGEEVSRDADVDRLSLLGGIGREIGSRRVRG